MSKKRFVSTAGALSAMLALSTFGWMSCGERLVNAFAFYPEEGMQANLGDFDAPIESLFIETDDGVRVSAFYLPRKNAQRTFLFFHGNAGNASHRLRHAVMLWRLDANVLLMDYRGYGLSDGKPSEAGIYLDGEAGLRFLNDTKGIPIGQIVLFGRSIGTAVAVRLAQGADVAGLVLLSPFSSGRDIMRAKAIGWLAPWVGEPFDSQSRVDAMVAPLLVFHGDKDNVIPTHLGVKLFEAATVEKELVLVPGAGHNDLIDIDPRGFLSRVGTFLDAVAPR